LANAGLYMLALVPVLLIATGLPAFIVLITIATVFAIIGVLAGAFPHELLQALPYRILGLLDNDLLQALPLYVLMGALLNRLALAERLFRVATSLFRRSAAAPLLGALGLGALLAPMNGAVGASVATLARIVLPRLQEYRVSEAEGLAAVCVASTLGVVVPPSLVLILLGDQMLRAHTEAMNITGHLARAINTQDIFRGALPAAAIFFVLTAVLMARIGGRAGAGAARPEPVAQRERAMAVATLFFVVALLAAVVAGYVYAVEAAATGGTVLFVAGLASRRLTLKVLRQVLRDTAAISGALFAVFVGATSFTLVLRAFNTDLVIAGLIGRVPGGAGGAVLAVLLLLWFSAFALDAFEIIFVLIPLLMPPLLTRVDDPVWVSVLALLALQSSFLLPPLGYAVMVARSLFPARVDLRALAAALLPFVAIQLLVLGVSFSFPRLAHLALPTEPSGFVPKHELTGKELEQRLQQQLPPGDPER
jgi:tripartite ATP-independent transporter DctM subunit